MDRFVALAYDIDRQLPGQGELLASLFNVALAANEANPVAAVLIALRNRDRRLLSDFYQWLATNGYESAYNIIGHSAAPVRAMFGEPAPVLVVKKHTPDTGCSAEDELQSKRDWQRMHAMFWWTSREDERMLEQVKMEERKRILLAAADKEPEARDSSSATAPLRAPSNECVVCMDREPEAVLVPCGHLCMCMACVPSITDCPICRVPIQLSVKTYRV